MSCYQFEPRGDAEDTLLSHFPTGIAWLAWCMPGKTANKLLKAFADAYEDMTEALCRLFREVDYRTTNDLVENWEEALSLPDKCLPKYETLEQRRQWIAFRLTKKRWTTAQDWIDLGKLYGLEVEVTPGWLVQKRALFWVDDEDNRWPEFPWSFDIFPKLGRFRVYVDVLNIEYPGFVYGRDQGDVNYGFPIPFSDGPEIFQLFKCIIDRVKPANAIVIWNDNPLRLGCYIESFEDSFDETFC